MANKTQDMQVRERLSFNDAWRFSRERSSNSDSTFELARLRDWIKATGTDLINEGVEKPMRPDAEPDVDEAFTRSGYDDRDWRLLRLPHDWGIEGPFAQELPGETGKLPCNGVGWYRKRFTVDASHVDDCLFLDVDGAMSHSAIWLNGKFAGGWPYGYSSFRIDLTPYLKFGEENLIAIRLESSENSSRWYPGAGIYRNLWLVRTTKVRIRHWGVFVTTPHVSSREAIVNVEITIENTSDAECALSLQTSIYELDAHERLSKKPVAVAEPCRLDLRANTQTMRTPVLLIKKPRLWSLTNRNRYVVVTTLEANGRLVDRVETPFGVRTIRFEAGDGFWLNGARVQLKGVCLHHDLGALGTALHLRALERQIEILQEMGCNSIRTSHNPPAPELLELCDRMGMLVMDEAFDCWRRGKKWPANLTENDACGSFFDYAADFDDWHERDLRALVRRDRNHPCIVMWSIGNEVIEQWHPDGWKLATRLAGIVREEDRSRPVTSAFNAEAAAYTGFQTALDIIGFNYKPKAYEALRNANPTMPMIGAETASTISTRGEYFFPVSEDPAHGQVNFQVSSYDLTATSWANIPDVEFRGLDECLAVAGEFVWTGFDYLGEPTPYNSDASNLLNFSDPEQRRLAEAELERLGRIRVPSRSSYFGIIDLAGFPKDRYYLYQARWRPKLRFAHILPHWNWPERVGEVTPVHVYSSAHEAELFLNGVSQGKRKRRNLQYRFRWDDVVYEPGVLKVVTTMHGKKWATATRRTTGAAQRVRLSSDCKILRANGSDLAFVTVSIADANDELVPRSHNLLQFSLSGPGEIVALDNGDPTSLESFQGNQRRAFNGLALVVVRSIAGELGKIVLDAQSEGLRGASVTLQSKWSEL
jgi:beta-galactosidase